MHAHQNASSKRIVKPLNELNRRALATPRSTHKRHIRARFDNQIQVAEHPHPRPRWVPEMNAIELNLTMNRLGVDDCAFG